jgi:hypothetical protein
VVTVAPLCQMYAMPNAQAMMMPAAKVPYCPADSAWAADSSPAFLAGQPVPAHAPGPYGEVCSGSRSRSAAYFCQSEAVPSHHGQAPGARAVGSAEEDQRRSQGERKASVAGVIGLDTAGRSRLSLAWPDAGRLCARDSHSCISLGMSTRVVGRGGPEGDS